MDELLFEVESLSAYKSILEEKEDIICSGMTNNERKAYRLGVQNMYNILHDIIEQDLNEGKYNIFVLDNIRGIEFDLSDFIKWDSERNKDIFDRKKIDISTINKE